MTWQQKTACLAVAIVFCGCLVRSAASVPVSSLAAPTVLSAVASRHENLSASFAALENRMLASVNDAAAEFVADEDLDVQESKLITLPGGAESISPEITVLPAGDVSIHNNGRPAAPSPALETAALPLPITASAARQTQPVVRRPAAKFREIWAIVTAYCPCSRCCGSQAHGRTSLGKTAWIPGIAADPRALAYGTKIMVPGYGLFTVDDTGGAMRQSWRRRGRVHIDVRMKYHDEARRWGRKMMKIRVYEP